MLNLGCDLSLMDSVLECLETAGRPTSVLTGRDMFGPPGPKDACT